MDLTYTIQEAMEQQRETEALQAGVPRSEEHTSELQSQ